MPTRISYNKIPRVQISTVKSWPCPLSISGLRYSAVPQNDVASLPGLTLVARPKSAKRR